MARAVEQLIQELLDLDRAGRQQVFGALVASLDAEREETWEDPIVAEVHRIRQELLNEFGGDVDALMDEANRRLLSGEFGPRKIVSFPPRRPKQMPEAAAG